MQCNLVKYYRVGLTKSILLEVRLKGIVNYNTDTIRVVLILVFAYGTLIDIRDRALRGVLAELYIKF